MMGLSALFCRSMKAVATLLSFALCTSALPTHAEGQEAGIIVRNVTLIDGTGSPPRPGVTVVVRDGLVVDVTEQAASFQPEDVILDGTGLYLVPGLIDTHVHFLAGVSDADRDDAAAHLGWFLAQGVTGIRDMEGHVDLRDAVRAGRLVGPRVHASGLARQASEVARLAEEGVDGIKFRNLTQADALEVIRASRAVGLPVYGHTFSRDELPWPNYTAEIVRSGLSGVVHVEQIAPVGESADEPRPPCGYDRECAASWWLYHASLWLHAASEHVDRLIQEMIDHDVWLEPTLAFVDLRAHHERYAAFDPDGFYDWYTGGDLQRFQSAYEAMQRFVKRFHDAGGVVIAGTDKGDLPLVYELEELHAAGLAPLDVLRAATQRAAEALGWGEEVGTVEPGKQADLLVLRSNPLEDLRSLEEIHAVIASGRIFPEDELEAMRTRAATKRREP